MTESKGRVYVGHRDGETHSSPRVHVEHPKSGFARPLEIRTQKGMAYPKSPDGHAWGYGGSGPSQLALDVLWDVFDREPHPSMFHTFKREFIEGEGGPRWMVTEDEVRAFVDAFQGERWVDEETDLIDAATGQGRR